MIKSDLVKKLRERTGVGIMECKEALKQANGNLDEAVIFLRKKGLAKAKRRATHQTNQGVISAYIHTGGKIGAMVEVNCETDFVSRNKDFQDLAKGIAMQIVATNPIYIKRDEVPPEVIEKEKEILSSQIEKNKPEDVLKKIVQGKLEKYFQEVCLLEQAFIKDPKINIEEHLHQNIAKIGENIEIKRFARFKLGEEIE